jgi:plastocyanin
MSFRFLVPIAAFLSFSALALAENIDGQVVVTKKLTRRRVTASLPIYQRGKAVELAPDAPEDSLAFEREHVVLYVDGRHFSPAITATIDQQNRRFRQDTVVIPAGSKVSFPNQDPIFHNVFSLSKAKSFDLGNYSIGETRVVTFPEPGIVFVGCHLHANMAATIVVTPNQWYARADRDGHFSIHDVPPGEYKLIAWHKAAGFISKTVRIAPGENANVEFLVPLDERLQTSLSREFGEIRARK